MDPENIPKFTPEEEEEAFRNQEQTELAGRVQRREFYKLATHPKW